MRRELQLATEALHCAEAAVSRRAELSAAVTEAESVLATHTAGLAEAEERRDVETRQLAELGERLEQAQQAEKESLERLRSARRAHRLVTDAARRTTLRAQLTAVRELSERITQVRAATAGRPVSDADVRAVEDATNDLTLARRLRAQAAARLEFSGPAGATVTVDGEAVPLDATVELAEGTELVIGEITARYRAGHTDSSGGDPVVTAEGVLRDLLDGLDLSDLDAVRAARDNHRRASEDLAGLLRERTTLLAGEDEESLDAELTRLDSALADEEIPDLDAVAAARAVEEAEEAREQAAAEVGRVDRALTPWRERRAENTLTALSVRIEAAEEWLRQATAARDAAAADADDAALAQAVSRPPRPATRWPNSAVPPAEVAAADPNWQPTCTGCRDPAHPPRHHQPVKAGSRRAQGLHPPGTGRGRTPRQGRLRPRGGGAPPGFRQPPRRGRAAPP